MAGGDGRVGRRLKSEFAFFQSSSQLLFQNSPTLSIGKNVSGVEFLRTISNFRKRKKISTSLVYVLLKK